MTENKDLLAAKIKEMEVIINSLTERIEKIDERRAQVEKQKSEEGVKRAEQTEDKKIKEEKPFPPKRDVKDAYLEAYQVYKSNNLQEAREKFQSILDDYPENEFSDNARFWIGESFYKEKKYDYAIVAYDELLKNNPESDKVPGALLKQGLAFFALKKDEVARTILKELIKKYPDTKQAQIAKRELALSAPADKKK